MWWWLVVLFSWVVFAAALGLLVGAIARAASGTWHDGDVAVGAGSPDTAG